MRNLVSDGPRGIGYHPRLPLTVLSMLMGLQILSAGYFAVDGLEDWLSRATQGFSFDLAMECVIAIALLTGIVISCANILNLYRDLHWKEQSLARARRVITDHITLRFQDWGLTGAEAEVALFALKGCDVAEIARLRGAAAGTVRSQLSQIYSKAGVTSQAMLVSMFLDDLIDASPIAVN